MNNNLTLSVTLTGDGRQLSGTLQDARKDVREFGTTTERESRKADTALTAPGRSAVTVSDHLRDTQREARNFGTETVQSSRQATQALSQTGDQTQTVNGYFSHMRTLVMGVGAALVGAFGARSVINQAGLINDADALANSIGIATSELQAWDYAAQRTGLSAGTIGDIFKDVSDKLGDFAATGGGEAADLFENLNLQVSELLRLSPDQQLLAIAEALSSIEDPSQRVFYLESLANDATRLLPLLENNAAGLRTLTDEAYSLGVAMNQVDIDNALQADRAMAQLQGTVQGFVNILAADLGPTMAETVGSLTELIRQAGGADQVLQTVTNTVTVVGAAAGAYGAYRAVIASATVAQWAFNTAVRANPLGIAITLLGAAAGALYTFTDEAKLAGDESYQTSLDVDGLADSFRLLTEAQQENKRASLLADLIEMRVEAGRLGSELVEVSRKVQNSGQLTPQGGALPIATAEDVARGRELRGELAALLADINGGTQLLGEYEEAMEGLGQTTSDTGTRTRTLAETTAEASKAANELAQSTQAQADALEDLRNRLRPGRREVVQLADDMRTLTLAIATGTGNVAENIQMMGLLQQRYIEAQKDTDNLANASDDAANRIASSFTTWGTVADNTIRRVDDSGKDLWLGLIDGSRNAMDTVKRGIQESLAEIAHMLTTQKFTVKVAGMLGLDTTGMAGGGGGFNLNGIGSLYNSAKNLPYVGDAISGVGTALGFGASAAAPVSYASGFGAAAATGTYSGFAGNAAAAATQASGGFLGAASATAPWLAGGMLIDEVLGLGIVDGIVSGLSGLFGSDKQPEFSYQQDGRAPADYDFGGRQSAFGSFGFEQTRLGEEGRAALDEFSSSLQAADNALAKYMTDGQIAAASAALDEFAYSGLSNADLLADRLDVLLNAAGMQGELYNRMREELQGADASQRYESALNIAALEATLESVPDNVLAHVEARLASSDVAVGQLSQSLSIQVQQWQTLRGQLELISPTFDSLTIGAVDVTNALVDAAGGLENLQGLYNSYYQNFFTEEERQARLQEQLTEQFAALNMELPGSRAEFRSLVESLDVTTASGRDAQLSLMGLSSSFAQLTAASQQPAASQNAAALSYSSIVGIDGAISDYNTSVSLAQDLAQRRKAQLQDEMRAVDQLSGLIDSLLLSNQSTLNPAARLQEAQRQFAALEVRAQNGDTDAAGQLQGASQAYLNEAASYFGQSSSQYANIFNDVTGSVRSLEDRFGDSVAALGSIESIDRQLLREQQRARDTLTRTLSEQIQANEELGTLSGLLEALPQHLASALSGILGERTTPNGNTYIPGGFDAEGTPLLSGASGDVANAYRDILGRDPDDSGSAYWQSRLDSGTSIERIREEMAAQAADGYHRDGLDRVPFDGYRAVLHEDETVLNAQAAAAWRQQQRMPAPKALSMARLPPLPFASIGSNQPASVPAINLEPLLRKIDTLTAEVAQLRSERRQDAERAAGQRSEQVREQRKGTRSNRQQRTTL